MIARRAPLFKRFVEKPERARVLGRTKAAAAHRARGAKTTERIVTAAAKLQTEEKTAPSVDKIAEAAHVDESTVRRALKSRKS